MTSTKRPFSKREWIQTTILLSLVQAFFWYAVFENSQSASALGYVSFAGTLVSIILAVLAIGYTYGESISHKNKSDGLTNQISTLERLIENVELEAKSLEKIEDIANQLTGFIGGYRTDKEKSENQLKDIRATVTSLTTLNPKVPSHTVTNSQLPLSTILSNRSPLDELCYLLIVYIEQNSNAGITFVESTVKKVLSETPMGLDPVFFHGAIYTQSSLLQNLGLISNTDDEDFRISSELRHFIIHDMLSLKNESPDDSYNRIINKVHKLVLEGEQNK